jgi:hypothetical protein
VDNKEFQNRVINSFTRLEEGQVKLTGGQAKLEEGQARLEGGQAELRQEIRFVHDDLNSKIEMIANAIKELVERMATKEEYEKRFRDLETRMRELEHKIGQ